MFCQKCGVKAIEGASFCQKCGAKLVKDEEIQSVPEPMTEPVPKPAETPTLSKEPVSQPIETPPLPEQMLVQESRAHDNPNQNPESIADIYKKTKKASPKAIVLLCILAVAIAAVIIVAIFLNRRNEDSPGDVRGSLNEEYTNSEERPEDASNLLTGEYINSEEGISFNYPANWTMLDSDELDGTVLNVLTYIIDSTSNAFFFIHTVPKGLYDAGISDYSEQELLDGIYDGLCLSASDVSDFEGSITMLSNIPAVKSCYSSTNKYGDRCVTIQYVYNSEDTFYYITMSTYETMFNSYLDTFNAIMDSYTITDTGTLGGTTTSFNSGEIYYKDIPMSELLSATTDDVVKLLGVPTILDREYCIYDDITFELSSGGLTTSVEVDDSSLCSINGVTLNKNRDGLVEILGEPLREGDSVRGYYLSYELPNYNLHINMGEPQGTEWRVSVSPVVP